MTRRARLAKIPCFDRLEDRLAPAGLTLIAHGLGSGVNDWVAAMADAVAGQAASRAGVGASDVAEIKLTVNGNLSVTAAWVPNHHPDPSRSVSPETIVLLDWSSVAGS